MKNEKMVIVANGDVGIGKTLPSFKLDVAGNTRPGGAISSGNSGIMPASGSMSLGNTSLSYSPNDSTWVSTGSTLLLNAQDYSTLVFHDSGSRVDFIRAGAGKIQLGYNGGFGEACIGLPGSGGLYAPKEIYTRQGYNSEELRIRYSNYDGHGAIVSIRQENGVSACYVWGYGGDYLVAKIINAGYAAVSTALGGPAAIETFRNNKNPGDAAVEAFIGPLRTGLTGAQIESFTWHTLLSHTSHTDVKGLKTYFEYDIFCRLANIKDQDGNIVKSYGYHYKD
ncbi:hypothetical protein [Hufsiella ginkgonis]|uniref:Uncharacterized protein n=1 Tax=Hufsiella ginkgonis TaxID=2695274 RepID=A0A7K1XT34_9SPHI|nr:hypothetical protein [Hufsiella ginkgonis]MXV14155.1 hypothetical protein [Hufsiella ginkgonis]